MSFMLGYEMPAVDVMVPLPALVSRSIVTLAQLTEQAVPTDRNVPLRAPIRPRTPGANAKPAERLAGPVAFP